MRRIINYIIIVISSLIVGCGSEDSQLEIVSGDAAGTTISENESESIKSENSQQEQNQDAEKASSVKEITVYICGAVNKEGVYTFKDGQRICDAIEKAGGLNKEADSTFLNQAQLLIDGEKIYVPTMKEVNTIEASGIINSEGSSDKININTATKEALMSLSGVGESKANAIISHRNEKGKFAKIEDIKNVSGIGDGVYNTIKDFISV